MELVTTTFDYAPLDSEVRVSLRQRAERINERTRNIAQSIWENGREFYDAQQELAQHRHGRFIEWAEKETGYSKRTVYNYIDVYRNLNCANFAQLNIAASALYLLAAPSTPEEARNELLARAEAGEDITHAKAKAVIKHLHEKVEDGAIRPQMAATIVEAIQRNPENIDAIVEDVHEWATKPSPVAAPAPRLIPDIPADFVPTAEDYAADELLPFEEDMRGVSCADSAVSPRRISDDPDYDGDEWYTPADTIDVVRTALGWIDIDPASNAIAQKVIQAKQFYTKSDNGLAHPWNGTVFCNPPYSTKLIQAFVKKAIEEYQSGRMVQGILLVNNCTDADWFHTLAATAQMLCFTDGRIRFYNPLRSDVFPARQGQVFVYLGDNPRAFASAFSAIGLLVTRYPYAAA